MKLKSKGYSVIWITGLSGSGKTTLANKIFYELRNEVSTRQNSFKTKYIKINNHNEWYKKNLLKKKFDLFSWFG